MKTITMEASELHLELARDIATICAKFHREYPEIDALELVAILGGVIGAQISSNPDPVGRAIARQSVIDTMDQAIDDYVEMRGRQ